jgi:capsular exopolysaccharide synthesis family protein
MEKDIQVFEPPRQTQLPDLSLGYQNYGGASSSPLREYWRILLRRKWWALGFLGITIGIALWSNAVATPIYQGTATLRVNLDTSAYVGPRDPMGSLYHDDDRIFETQAKMMQSRSLAKRVIKLLNLSSHPDFMIIEQEGAKKIPAEEAESGMVDTFLANLKVVPVRRSDIVRISYDSPDKDLAQKVPNIFTEEYMQFEIDCKNQSFAIIKRWLAQQLAQTGSIVEGSQRKLYAYGEAGEILSPEEKDNVIVTKYIELNGLMTKASAERIAKEAQHRQITKSGAAATPITNNPLVMDLRKQISTESAKVASLKKIYLPDHPKLMAEQANLQGLQARLNNEIQNTRATVEADYEAARRTENLITEALESEKLKVADLQKKLVQYKILKRDVETNEELYKGLLSRMKEASVASTMVASSISVIDPAEKPLFPYLPKTSRNLALAILIGTLGGVFLAFTIEHFDNSIKSAEVAERACQLPILGLIPQIRLKKELPFVGQEQQLVNRQPGLISYSNPKSVISDAIFMIRTAVLLSGPGNPPAAIMVTSPNPSEGKSTMSANLATALAMDGSKVVLIDGDLRSPCIHKLFNIPVSPGLTNMLTGTAALKDVIRQTEVPNLHIITSGPVPPNPVTLLGSTVFKDAMDYLRNEFQHIIIDTPPTVSMPESRILSPLVDGTILVLKHNSTPLESARIAAQMLRQVHTSLLGVVLNQVSFESLGYGSYYYYNYNKYYSNDA